MNRSILLVLFSLCVLVMLGGTLYAQKTAIKIEAMDPHRLETLGFENLNDHDNVTTGLPVVGKGTWVYMSGWDVTDDEWAPGSDYLWELTSRPANSAAILDSTTMQWTSLHTDSAGTYTVKLTIGGKDTSINIIAANYVGADRNNVGGSPMNCLSCHSGATPEIVTEWSGSGHATIFENGMNGTLSSHWGESCFPCHTTGWNMSANNGGWDDVADEVGFDANEWMPWRAGLYDSLLTTDKAKLSMLSGIGCEDCHGPKSPNHFGAPGTQPKSFEVGVCAQCHNEPLHHNKVMEFENSVHAEAIWSGSFDSDGATPVTDWGLGTCVRCHDGAGFVAFTKGESFDNRISSGYGALTHTKINCQTCHNPHEAALRSAPAGSDTLGNGYDYSAFNFGEGKICVNCHKYRRDAETYVLGTVSSHFGPHHRGAADVFLGQNAITFGANLTNSIGHRLVDDLCVGCHMADTPDTSSAAHDMIGGHSWNMEYVGTDSTEYDNVAKCVECHTGITSFDDIIAGFDYDMDGTHEPFQEEVEGLLEELAKALPPLGSTDISGALISADPDSANMKKAYYNYAYVEEDGSKGAHNPKFIIGLLQVSLATLTGVDFSGHEPLPAEYVLTQNYPNPFNPSTTIKVGLVKSGTARLEVFNVLGARVTTLMSGTYPPGVYEVTWDGHDASGRELAGGIYIYRLQTADFTSVKKMILMK